MRRLWKVILSSLMCTLVILNLLCSSGIVTSKIIKRNTHTQNSWTNGGRVHSSPQFIRDSFVSSASEPHFRSKPKTFRVEQDKSVTLPCYVDNLGDHSVVWRKGHEVLTAANILLSRDPRYKLHKSDFSLELQNIRPNDAGDFVCQLSTLEEAMEIAHTVEVLVPPRVRAKPEDGNIVVKKGTEVTLECSASGNPVPTVTWTRDNDLLPEGTYSGQNRHSYTISNVDRFHAGKYTCRAANGVGMEATAKIALQVLYEPEIEVESEKVHSGVGKEAHLTCIVHGEPRPTVRWFKENTELRPSGIGSSIHPKIFIESKENTHRHTLVLRGLVNKNDFGNYSCVAENSLGTSKRHIEVHGRPTMAVFRNKPHQAGAHSFQLVWTTDSYSPIEEYRLLYRQIKPTNHPDDGFAAGSDWTNIIIPGESRIGGSSTQDAFHHEKSFPLSDLVPEAEYECLVQAKNIYGWSEASRIHRFYTHYTTYEPAARDLGWTSGATHIFGSSSRTRTIWAYKYAILQFVFLALVRQMGSSLVGLTRNFDLEI